MDTKRSWNRVAMGALVLLVAVAVLSAQNSPRVTGVEPVTSKVGQSITIAGEHLGKGTVAAVYLSDNDADFKAVIVEQQENKIVVKVPTVKAGEYNVSIQIKNDILIQPVRITIE